MQPSERRRRAERGAPASSPHRVVLAALISGTAERRRLAGALRDVDIRFCDEERQLSSVVAGAAGAGNPIAIVAELGGPHRDSIVATVRSLHDAYPLTVVVLYMSLNAVDVRHLLAHASDVVAGVAFRGIDDIGTAVEAALAKSWQEGPARCMLEAMAPVLPPHLTSFVSVCAARSAGPLTVAAAAAASGVPVRTVVAQLRRAGLPGPSRIIGWGRVLHAAWLLDEPGRTLEQIAAARGFPSASSLSNMLRRYTACAPSVARTAGAFALALAAFTREMKVPGVAAPSSRARSDPLRRAGGR